MNSMVLCREQNLKSLNLMKIMFLLLLPLHKQHLMITITQSAVEYAGDNATGLEKIITQKYLADDVRINSNDKNYNPNTTVFKFINNQPGFKGKVAAFSSWDCFSYIINDKRSGVFVSSGLVEAKADKLTERENMLNQLLNTIPNPLGDVRLDAYTFY